jgi:hypothetical protein
VDGYSEPYDGYIRNDVLYDFTITVEPPADSGKPTPNSAPRPTTDAGEAGQTSHVFHRWGEESIAGN